jgi:glycine hydroxymethyltransferase
MQSKKTVLYEDHLRLGASSHMAEFAGYIMPLWYSSISAEHSAVRQRAGLFDCAHMGIFEFSGPEAEEFLNFISTNNVSTSHVGQAKYSYILDADGKVLDDIITYKQASDRFMVVVNAANEPKIKAWLKTVLANKSITKFNPTIIDLRGAEAGHRQRVDIALQGPASIKCLADLTTDNLSGLKPFTFLETTIKGINVIVSRTGYTGAITGFELYVHPEKASQMVNIILEQGIQYGIIPCGLGSRDSLRIEAGLPLYGHELAGKFNISPFEAGYGWAVKLDKPCFIGKDAIDKKSKEYNMQVVRSQFSGQKGVRPLRENDGILDADGTCLGWVLSCAKIDDRQIALVYIEREKLAEGQKVGAYYLARNQSQIDNQRKENVDIRQKLDSDIYGVVLSRFEKF